MKETKFIRPAVFTVNGAFLFVKVLNQIQLKMPAFKTLISIAEAAEQKMKECSDDDINAADTVILLPDNADSLTDDEKAQDNPVMIDNGFPSDIFGTKKDFWVRNTTKMKWRMMVMLILEPKMRRKN